MDVLTQTDDIQSRRERKSAEKDDKLNLTETANNSVYLFMMEPHLHADL